MRKIKLFLFMIILVGVSGCSKPNRAEIAQNLLKEKYNEDFKIYGSGEGFGSLTGNTFMVVAAPVKNQDFKFEATVEKDGGYINDEYVQAKLEDEIKTIMSDDVDTLSDDYAINVYVAWAESKNSISIEEYTKMHPEIPIVIDIIFDKEKMKNGDIENEYAVLSRIFSDKLPINAALDIYYSNEHTLWKCHKYFSENAETYDDYYDLLEGSDEVLIGITNGQFNVTLNQFIEKRVPVTDRNLSNDE